MESKKYSKPIFKTDEDAKRLIIEALDGKNTGGFDIDSMYQINEGYVLIEFLKCDTVRPYDSHPNRYWFKNKTKFLTLWGVAKKLDAILYLVNYEDTRVQFKVILVRKMDDTGIVVSEEKRWNFSDFKEWFQELNKGNIIFK